jgi:tRNA methyltransferase complex GCD14 subunit
LAWPALPASQRNGPKVLNPKTVIEIGTGTGASALAMLKFMAPDGHLYTFDLVPWWESPGHILTDEDFRDGRLVQVIDDLTVRDGLMRHIEVVRSAQLIFMDAAKDGTMEDSFLRLLGEVPFAGRVFAIFDDIRLYNMLATWRRIASPKIDLTSFGHFTGTGMAYTPIRLKRDG